MKLIWDFQSHNNTWNVKTNGNDNDCYDNLDDTHRTPQWVWNFWKYINSKYFGWKE